MDLTGQEGRVRVSKINLSPFFYMINTGLLLVGKKRVVSSFVVALFLVGCASSNKTWEGGRNYFIGKKVDPELFLRKGAYGAGGGSFFFSGANKNWNFDKIVEEGDGRPAFET